MRYSSLRQILFSYFNIYVFEFEDESMPIWKDKELFEIKVYKDDSEGFPWQHGGLNWTHCGMDSITATNLRDALLSEVRRTDSMSVHKSWQYKYEFPLIPNLSRHENLLIERLFDKLIFLPKDYPEQMDRVRVFSQILDELKTYGVFYCSGE